MMDTFDIPQKSAERALANFSRLLNHLLTCDDDMTVSRLNVFIHAARAEGCTVRHLCTVTGLNQSTVARTLSLLSEKTMRGKKEPLGWVRVEPDPEDPRRRLIYTTAKGRKVLHDIREYGGF